MFHDSNAGHYLNSIETQCTFQIVVHHLNERRFAGTPMVFYTEICCRHLFCFYEHICFK